MPSSSSDSSSLLSGETLVSSSAHHHPHQHHHHAGSNAGGLRATVASLANAGRPNILNTIRKTLGSPRRVAHDTNTTSGVYSTPAESALPSSDNVLRYRSPTTEGPAARPTIEQIAMGLHVSRTPHLGPSSSSSSAAPSHLAHPHSRPSRPVHRRSASTSHTIPLRSSFDPSSTSRRSSFLPPSMQQQHPAPRSPLDLSLPRSKTRSPARGAPPPKRSSLKRSSTLLDNPINTSASSSGRSTPTLLHTPTASIASSSTAHSSSRGGGGGGAPTLAGLKWRMTNLLRPGGDKRSGLGLGSLSKGSEETMARSSDELSRTVRKAVRFNVDDDSEC